MQRVTGIGGIFFKARDAERQTSTVWSVFAGDTNYFEPSSSPFMVNYRVDDLDAVLALLRAEDCDVDERVEEAEFGRFGWVVDPEGNKLELWEPPRV